MRKEIMKAFPEKPVDIRTYSPLAMAFIGDAVYSMIIRTIVVSKGNRQADKLHRETSAYVKAKAQAELGKSIYEALTEEERNIYKRGRNANPAHHAKNASLDDYLEATALETLCGYLYLTDQMERLLSLMADGFMKDK